MLKSSPFGAKSNTKYRYFLSYTNKASNQISLETKRFERSIILLTTGSHFTYVEAPVHFDYVGVVKRDERLPLPEDLLLLACLHDLALLDHLNCVVLPRFLLLGHEHFAEGALSYKSQEFKTVDRNALLHAGFPRLASLALQFATCSLLIQRPKLDVFRFSSSSSVRSMRHIRSRGCIRGLSFLDVVFYALIELHGVVSQSSLPSLFNLQLHSS